MIPNSLVPLLGQDIRLSSEKIEEWKSLKYKLFTFGHKSWELLFQLKSEVKLFE